MNLNKRARSDEQEIYERPAQVRRHQTTAGENQANPSGADIGVFRLIKKYQKKVANAEMDVAYLVKKLADGRKATQWIEAEGKCDQETLNQMKLLDKQTACDLVKANIALMDAQDELAQWV